MRGLTALVVVALLAGCSQSPDPAAEPTGDQDPKSSVSLEDREPREEDVPTGDVRGVVVDELNLSLEGAHVALTPTGLFMKSNATGGFLFPGLSPGRYVLRIDAAGHNSSEVPVTVESGKVTVVRVVLLIAGDRVGDARPHEHDLWRGQDTLVVMDHDVVLMPHEQFEPTNVYSRAFVLAFYAGFLAVNQSFEFSIPVVEDQPSIVVPGTEAIEVQFTWAPTGATNLDLGLSYAPPGEQGFVSLPAKASGGTWTIPVEPQQTDNGHQAWTFWRFRIHEGAIVSPHLQPGTVHVKMTLHRGDLFYEAPHREFWDGETHKVLLDTQAKMAASASFRHVDTVMSFPLPEETLVPPGSDRMRIEMEYEHSTAPTLVDKDLRVSWRAADQNPFYTPPSKFRTTAPTDVEKGRVVYEFDLAKEEPDRYYQTESNWLFRIAFPEDDLLMVYGHEDWQVTFRVEVWNDP